MWKLETAAKGNFVYVSLLKQQGNSDFKFISVCFSAGQLYTLPTYSFVKIVYQHTVSLKLYDLKIESIVFFSLDSSFYIKQPFNKEKNTFWFVLIISFYWY